MALAVLLALVLFAIRVSAPHDLLDNDQLKPAHYINDVLLNQAWIVQTDHAGSIASKPPLQVWIGALASLPFERATWATIAIPSLLGMIGVTVLAVAVAHHLFGRVAAWLAGPLVLVSMMGAKQVALIRTDALFGFMVALTAVVAWIAWRSGRRGGVAWPAFWGLAALATLTKGPIGPAIASLGLLAAVWPRRFGERTPPTEPASAPRLLAWHLSGLAMLLLIAGGWFVLAWADAGQPFIDKLIGAELVGHAVESGKGDPPGLGLYKSPAYFLWWYAPASILAVIGLLRLDLLPRRVAPVEHRAVLRFLGLWLVLGLLIFALSPHQRADLLTPMWLPTAVLGAGVLARLIERPLAARPVLVRAAFAGVLAAALAGVYVHRHHFVLDKHYMVRGRAIEQLADRLRQSIGLDRLAHFNAHSSLQWELNTMLTRLEPEESADWLRESPDHLIATSANTDPLLSELTRAERERLLRYDGVAIDRFELNIFTLPEANPTDPKPRTLDEP
jgi:4-amino-4-deoxy-L-arabinose transferase-like glycosyltransferase